jgi:hypothetical protein
MKGIDSTGALLVHVPGWMGGWMDGCKSNQKHSDVGSFNKLFFN